MDVLQIIKADHTQLKAKLAELEVVSTDGDVQERFKYLLSYLELYLKLEVEYLYPELLSFERALSVPFAKASRDRQTQLSAQILELRELLGTKSKAQSFDRIKDKIHSLTALASFHLSEQEQILVPRVREVMPTSDREDLGAVFLDVKESESKDFAIRYSS